MDGSFTSPDTLCRYDGTRLRFRGPAKSFVDPYIAVLGGSDTFGKGLEAPYPTLLERKLGETVINFGVMHAGVSLFSDESWLIERASAAHLTILQVMGAQNMSNRLYSVHTRRNDRFVGVSPALRELFPDVDFTEIHFTGHLLRTLSDRRGSAFGKLKEELKWAWVQRMKRVISMISGDIVLLWLSSRTPEDDMLEDQVDPLFVDASMLSELNDHVLAVVKAAPEGERDLTSGSQLLSRDAPNEQENARWLHKLAAQELADVIRQFDAGQSRRERQALA